MDSFDLFCLFELKKICLHMEFEWRKEVDRSILVEICSVAMPFGKYKGVLICDLPIDYLLWFNSKGYPKGRIGELLLNTFEIRANGMDALLRKLKMEVTRLNGRKH